MPRCKDIGLLGSVNAFVVINLHRYRISRIYDTGVFLLDIIVYGACHATCNHGWIQRGPRGQNQALERQNVGFPFITTKCYRVGTYLGCTHISRSSRYNKLSSMMTLFIVHALFKCTRLRHPECIFLVPSWIASTFGVRSNCLTIRHVRGSQSRIYDPRRSLD